MLNEKDIAPDFELHDDTGKPTKLSDFKGRRVVLYFYPKAMTSGCTVQACALRDDYPLYQESGAVVIGVSYDSVKDIAKFKVRDNLPFILLADENHEVAEKYGMWVEKTNYGKK